MWKLPEVVSSRAPDAARLERELAAHADFFAADRPLVVCRAPGRLDLMGGFADYSGGLVLEMPLERAAFAAVQADPGPRITVRSADIGDAGNATVSLPLGELAPGGAPIAYDAARARFSDSPAEHWASYIIGALLVLMREKGVRLEHGLRALLVSDVPLGKGVSSSAAIEVASMQAMAALLDVELDGRELALLCQKAENLVVGAPCGVMDQITAVFGRRDTLVALLCQPAELQEPVPIPENTGVWAIDSGIRHAITGADYTSVRVGTFMGYRIIADMAGLPAAAADDGRVRIEDPIWGGYLANLDPSTYEARFRSRLPETISGREFLAHYGGTTDSVTRVVPSRLYAVRRPVEHPVYEQQRVRLVRALLRRDAPDDETLRLIGEMMYQAHGSYNACNIGSDGTDRLVARAREAGPRRGIYGAKITGGGSGGFVALLGGADAGDAVREIAARYRDETGKGGEVLHGASDGALAFGAVIARPG
ncbi:MAG TPA: galactokinase family protein [Candidatus Hydrogenedentes bacterium]|nr:galactokinase family protein [Candidatus Hydrogenedentota bacterium]